MADWLFCCASRERHGDEDAMASVNKLDEEMPLLRDEAANHIPPAEANVTHHHHADEASSQGSPKAGRKERSASFMQKLGNYGCFCVGDENYPKNKKMPAPSDSPSKDNVSMEKKGEKAPETAEKEKEQAEPKVEPKGLLAEKPVDKAEETAKAKEELPQVKLEETKKKVEPEQPTAAEPSPHLFVDSNSRITYRLLNGSQLYIEEQLVAIVNATDDPNQIAVTKGENGFKDDKLWRSNGPVNSAPSTGDWFSVAKLHGEELSVRDFQDRYPGSGVVHIKGFGAGMSTVYDNEVIADLNKFPVVVWDGDDYEADGFTKLVPMFLDSNSSGVAVSFKKRFEIPKFHSRWAAWMAKYPERIKVVAIDYPEDAESNGVEAEKVKYVSALPGWAQEYFALGRCAVKATGSKQVVALGGGGIAGNEAEAGFADSVHWTIYAISRGKKEAHPALCDFAHGNKSNEFIHFVTGKDSSESDAFNVAPASGDLEEHPWKLEDIFGIDGKSS